MKNTTRTSKSRVIAAAAAAADNEPANIPEEEGKEEKLFPIGSFSAWRQIMNENTDNHYSFPTHIKNGKCAIDITCNIRNNTFKRSSTSLKQYGCECCIRAGDLTTSPITLENRNRFIQAVQNLYPESEYDFTNMLYVDDKSTVIILCVTHNRKVEARPVNIKTPHTGGINAKCAGCYRQLIQQGNIDESRNRIILREWDLNKINERRLSRIPLYGLPSYMSPTNYSKCSLCQEYRPNLEFRRRNKPRPMTCCQSCENIVQENIEKANLLNPETDFKYCSGCNAKHPLDCFDPDHNSCHLRQENDRRRWANMSDDKKAERREQHRIHQYSKLHREREKQRDPIAYKHKQNVQHQKYVFKHPSVRYDLQYFSAIQRGIQFDDDMTSEYVINLYYQPCIYCGHEALTTLNGLDRLDNNIGYTRQNSASCCKNCNIMKGSLDPLTFIRRCYMIGLLDSPDTRFPAIENYEELWANTRTSDYVTLEKYARKRNMEFDVTRELFNTLTQQSCRFCHRGSPNTLIGVYRISSDRGYVSDNVIQSCSECNFMRKNISVQEFMTTCYDITDRCLSFELFSDPVVSEYISHIQPNNKGFFKKAIRNKTSSVAAAAAATPQVEETKSDESSSQEEENLEYLNPDENQSIKDEENYEIENDLIVLSTPQLDDTNITPTTINEIISDNMNYDQNE